MIPFDAWRREIEADLEIARTELLAGLDAMTAAEQAVAAAKRERRKLNEAIEKLDRTATLGSALHWRIREHENTLIQVDGQLVRARNDVKSARSRITDFEQSMAQIDRMTVTIEAVA
jgi:septal ring factor EnvC (AmiA/AmiB activator)